MPRRVQDIVPNDRRSIRNIPVAKGASSKEADHSKKRGADAREEAREEKGREMPIHRIEKSEKAEKDPLRRMPMTPPMPRTSSRKRGKWLLLTLAIIVVIAGAGYVASTYFSRATFTIVPKVLPIAVNGTYVAKGSPTEGALSYELVTIKGIASSTVLASPGPEISTKAQGKVTVYNSYSAQAVRLIAGTRLADDSGRVYRLTDSISIPGSKSAAMPGSIVTNIIADQPGEKYNISRSDSISDFKAVAYKGTAKYDAIYARIAEDISGGFIGTKVVVTPAALASTTATLKSSLIASLLAQVKTALPQGYMMYDGGYSASFASPQVGNTDKTHALVSLNGTLYGILFKKSDLVSRFAGSETVASFGSFQYTTPGLEALDFSIANLKDFAPDKKTALVIHAKGNMKLIGTIPADEIKKKLAGVALADTQSIFKLYGPVIESGTGELVPPWSKVPKDLKRISVVVEERR